MEPDPSQYPEEQAEADRVLIVEALERLSQDDCSKLRSCLEALPESAGEWITNEGQFPYFDYAVEVTDLRTALFGVGLSVPFDWSAWGHSVGPTTFPTDTAINSVRAITATIRGDRFSEGFLRARIEDGTLQAAVSTVLDWCDQRDQ